MFDVALYSAVPKKIGNRQLEVQYVAKKVLRDGEDEDFDLPEQIEVQFLEEDFSKVSDIYQRSCQTIDHSQITLINSNAQKNCSQ